jgi:tetratricopeptide (TPR) repeat protein
MVWLFLLASLLPPTLQSARDRQDQEALSKLAAAAAEAAQKANDPARFYAHALAESTLAEVALELRDKKTAAQAAERGIVSADKAVAAKPTSEHYRIQGTLCGQIIPANVLKGLRYGKCAQEAIAKAVELDPKSSQAYLSRAVGNYYLPSSFGGGADVALRDIDKSLSLSPNDADALMWKGIVLRKANRNAEARSALEKALKQNPNRVWIKQQLDKTPTQ